MKENNLAWLVGGEPIKVMPRIPFSDEVCDLLDALSKELRGHSEISKYPDVMTFAFWIRKAHIMNLKNKHNRHIRMGRGLIFHIAPSNVPINFAYSMVFGLLSGNSNLVRVSSKHFPQVDLICECLNNILEHQFAMFKNQIHVVQYERDKKITDYFSSLCHGRIIWGGDKTIEEIRTSTLRPRAVELSFADRYSFGVICPEKIVDLTQEDLLKLARAFYNDTYLMDQNACSTPHLIFWKGNHELTAEAQNRFWEAIYTVVKEKYTLESVKVVDKLTELYCALANHEEIEKVRRFENYVYVVTLKKTAQGMDAFRGKFGLFYELEIDSYQDISNRVNDKIQTCAYFGVDRDELVNRVLSDNLTGIDRIVPFGDTLNMDLIWDGYDLIESLSRTIG